jgi:hypothetical protein
MKKHASKLVRPQVWATANKDSDPPEKSVLLVFLSSFEWDDVAATRLQTQANAA